MKLSRRSEYACLALIYMAQEYSRGNIKMSEICEAKAIPKKYLEQILLQLKGAGLVRSSSGTGGGYALARRPNLISIAEVLRLIDGPLAPVKSVSQYFYESTPLEQEKKLLAILQDIRDYISTKLENTVLSDLLKEPDLDDN